MKSMNEDILVYSPGYVCELHPYTALMMPTSYHTLWLFRHTKAPPLSPCGREDISIQHNGVVVCAYFKAAHKIFNESKRDSENRALRKYHSAHAQADLHSGEANDKTMKK